MAAPDLEACLALGSQARRQGQGWGLLPGDWGLAARRECLGWAAGTRGALLCQNWQKALEGEGIEVGDPTDPGIQSRRGDGHPGSLLEFSGPMWATGREPEGGVSREETPSWDPCLLFGVGVCGD